jgi:hypothetical protein
MVSSRSAPQCGQRTTLVSMTGCCITDTLSHTSRFCLLLHFLLHSVYLKMLLYRLTRLKPWAGGTGSEPAPCGFGESGALARVVQLRPNCPQIRGFCRRSVQRRPSTSSRYAVSFVVSLTGCREQGQGHPMCQSLQFHQRSGRLAHQGKVILSSQARISGSCSS